MKTASFCHLLVADIFLRFACGQHIFKASMIVRPSFTKISKTDPTVIHDTVFAVNQQNLELLESIVLEISTPGNADYHNWMTYDEVAAMTSSSDSTNFVRYWLEANDAEVFSLPLVHVHTVPIL